MACDSVRRVRRVRKCCSCFGPQKINEQGALLACWVPSLGDFRAPTPLPLHCCSNLGPRPSYLQASSITNEGSTTSTNNTISSTTTAATTPFTLFFPFLQYAVDGRSVSFCPCITTVLLTSPLRTAPHPGLDLLCFVQPSTFQLRNCPRIRTTPSPAGPIFGDGRLWIFVLWR